VLLVGRFLVVPLCLLLLLRPLLLGLRLATTLAVLLL